MAKRIMTGLKLARIAAVDRPCQEGALAAITKGEPLVIAKAYVPFAAGEAVPTPQLFEYLKREFDIDQRKEMAASGESLPDGSFSIKSRADLKNAVDAVDRAKNKPKAKAHITARARAMDATSLLPAEWKTKTLELLGDITHAEAMKGFEDVVELFIGEMGAVDFNTEMAEMEAREYANGLLCEVDEAVCALRTVFMEINEDGTVTDKPKALQESLEQFKAHITGIIPEGLENAMVAAALVEAGFEITEGGALTKRENDMGYSIELKKSLGLPVTATDADVNKALDIQKGGAQFALNILKMSPEHLTYMAKAAQLQTTDGVAKQEFAALDPAARDEVIKKFPPAMSDKEKADAKAKEDKDADAKKAADLAKGADESLVVEGTTILKSAVGESTFAVMKSQQKAIEKAADERAVTVIAKRAAVDMSKISKTADDLGTLLHGIAKHDPKLADEVEAILKAASAQIAKGSLFTEVGKAATGATGDASAQIESLAQTALGAGTYKSIYKARDGIRKANPELAKQEETERKAGQQKAA